MTERTDWIRLSPAAKLRPHATNGAVTGFVLHCTDPQTGVETETYYAPVGRSRTLTLLALERIEARLAATQGVSTPPTTGAKRIWDDNLASESDFWVMWLTQEGFAAARGPRLEPNYGPPGDVLVHLDPSRSHYAILDVGSGPISTIGVHVPGKTISLFMVDPLADDYCAMLNKYGFHDTVRPIKVEGERLSSVFPAHFFDICSCANALDHSYDPITVLRQMVDVCKPGGWIFLSHITNVAEHENYAGLHQWNLDWRNERFVIWNKTSTIDVLEAIPELISIDTYMHPGTPPGMQQWMQRS